LASFCRGSFNMHDVERHVLFCRVINKLMTTNNKNSNA